VLFASSAARIAGCPTLDPPISCGCPILSAFFAERVGYHKPAPLCFAAGTPVHSSRGDVAIENIHEGDSVVSRNAGVPGDRS
jgi:hypothetical protein